MDTCSTSSTYVFNPVEWLLSIVYVIKFGYIDLAV